MQLLIRGQSTHVLECQGTETFADIKERVAALEQLQASDISLYSEGSPISEDSLVSAFEETDLELTVGLLGGKVHGSLARAGVPSLYLLPENASAQIQQTPRSERAIIKKQKELVQDLLATSYLAEKRFETVVADLPSSSKETSYDILLRNYHAVVKENEADSKSSSSPNFNKSENLAEKDGLVYIAGYLAKKHRKEYPDLGHYTYKEGDVNLRLNAAPSWVQNLSFGGLTQPSEEWQNNVLLMEKYFKLFHKDNFRNGNKIVRRTASFIAKKVKDIPKPLIESFSRQRLFMRIKYLNNQRTLYKRKLDSECRKFAKKMKKTIN